MNPPNYLNEFVCEYCGSNLDDFVHTESQPKARQYRFTTSCLECDREGTVVIDDGELVEFCGEAFFTTEGTEEVHHGWREEPSVRYREHYSLDPDRAGDVSSPEELLDFTHDDVQSGWKPTIYYECSCGVQYESKKRLVMHLKAVVENRGEGVVKTVSDTE